MTESLLIANQLNKSYLSAAGVQQDVLHDLSFSVDKGEFVAIMGPSGSGKSTLLNILSTLMAPTSGTVTINNKDIWQLSDKEVSKFRGQDMGFIFQNYNLIDSLTVQENISLPLTLQKASVKKIKQAVQKVAQMLHIEEYLNKYPSELSGGQQQRVGAARALVHNPALIFGDEPTGALDSENAREMMNYLTNINANEGISIIMVTHDAFSASFASRILFLTDGEITKTINRDNQPREVFYQQVLSELGNFN
ncbi:ABC transporter ATP-binding protein [Weissella sagaensis]|jgi:putative ABC transport system ATP-binding protein|nr:ABC transporter ATP-binding protein [Weissella sagaensis]KAA8435026.1 ABC transporter ATP-binding protein [Weissella paramesenteroides]MBU7568676.1 ABC transporter ATP-binding protein [Weissella hellenica]KAA8438917.1 ABC transporter ATP-binding protein [Weissella paramesenteroides]QDJ58336.1 ABC transporter ATP-binding protein [Weissella hellenica]QEA57328.1 ABC transporter ATP-binding protein [Weissella hellenica]